VGDGVPLHSTPLQPLVTGARRRDHIRPVLRQLHWLSAIRACSRSRGSCISRSPELLPCLSIYLICLSRLSQSCTTLWHSYARPVAEGWPHNVGKPPDISLGRPTRRTQTFILSGSINWAVSNFSDVCWSRHLVSVHEVKPVRSSYQSLCAVRGSNLAELNRSVLYSLVPPCVAEVTVDCALCRQSK